MTLVLYYPLKGLVIACTISRDSEMFLKLVVVVLILGLSDARETQSLGDKATGVRQKRLLFYDEEGNLVKTFKNPSLDFLHNAEKAPLFGSFFNMLRPSTLGVPTVYMIPVSDEVIQQISSDPVYQNKLLTLPRKELIIEPNTLCSGKRAQIPAKSCRNFLNCWDGWAFEQECPEGLLFAKEGYCDYPHNVDCSTRTNEPASSQPEPQCKKDFEAFRSEQSCNEFFICVDRAPVKFRCPADLAYNQKLGVCDYAYRVNCGQAVSMDEVLAPNQPGTPSEPPASPPNRPLADSPAISIPNLTHSGCSPTSLVDPSIVPAPQPPSASATIGSDGASIISDMKTPNSVVTTNSEFKSQTWSSSHVAISRQDAIRQLRHGSNIF